MEKERSNYAKLIQLSLEREAEQGDQNDSNDDDGRLPIERQLNDKKKVP